MSSTEYERGTAEPSVGGPAPTTDPTVRILPGRRQEHHLENAHRESEARGLLDIPIVDCDSHTYETVCLPEIIAYIEHPNIKRSFMFNPPEMIEHMLIGGSLGDRSAGGRLHAFGAGPDGGSPYPFDPTDGRHPVATTTLRAMDAMGIDYTILFPTPMLNLGLNPDLATRDELTWAFNRWLVEDVIPNDPRLLAMPLLPIHDPDQCLRNINAFAGRPGVVGFMITCLNYEPLHRNPYMKVFAAIDELGLPLAFHSAPNWRERPFQMLDSFLGMHALGFPFYAMVQMTNVVLTGMPERFPNIRWIFMEAGQAWVPFVIARLDNEYKQRASEAPLLTRLPSEYIRDFYFTTQPFESHARSADVRAMYEMMNGPRSLLYASDYPHQDFDTPVAIWDQPAFSEAEKRAILGESAMKLFQLPARTPAART